jgi:predicted  nucleic acid-binding Zn-ribbon protein
MEWAKMTNIDIRMRMASMEMEYESIKNQINNLISKLDNLDNEYNNGRKELEKRSKL